MKKKNRLRKKLNRLKQELHKCKQMLLKSDIGCEYCNVSKCDLCSGDCWNRDENCRQFYPADENLFCGHCGRDLRKFVKVMTDKKEGQLKKCRIYQIEANEKNADLLFANWKGLQKKNMSKPKESAYRLVFDDAIDTNNFEEIFAIFNTNHPQEYKGRSMSVSDVIELYDEHGSLFYYCDSVGFVKVEFDSSKIRK